MTAPLSVSTDNAAQIASLRQLITQLKLAASDANFRPSGEWEKLGLDKISAGGNTYISQLSYAQSQLDALTGTASAGPGNNLVAKPDAAPTFAGANLDIGRIGVDALKLLNYPGSK